MTASSVGTPAPQSVVAAQSPARRRDLPVDIELMRILDEKHAWTSIAFTAAHVGAVFVVDGSDLLTEDGQLDRARILAGLDAAMCRVPDLTKRMLASPLGITAPAWVPDERYDVARHVRFMDEVVEFSPQSLVGLAGLDRPALPIDRPLWQFTATRLTSGEVALGVRLHHVMGDAKWLFETLTMITDQTADAAAEAPAPARASDIARAPRSRWTIPVRAGLAWVREQPSLKAGWHEYWRKPFIKRARRMGGRNIRPFKEWTIRRKGLAAVAASSGTVRNVQVVGGRYTAAASALGGSVNDLLVAATTRAVDDDDRGIDLWVPVSRREKGDRVVRNHVRMTRVHAEPGATLGEVVKGVRTHIRRFVVGIDSAEPPVGRNIGYATYVPWSTSSRYLLGSPIRQFVAVPATDRTDELNTFALSYDGTLSITVSGRAELDVDGSAEKIRRALTGAALAGEVPA